MLDRYIVYVQLFIQQMTEFGKKDNTEEYDDFSTLKLLMKITKGKTGVKEHSVFCIVFCCSLLTSGDTVTLLNQLYNKSLLVTIPMAQLRCSSHVPSQ